MPYKDIRKMREYQRSWMRSRRTAWTTGQSCVDCGSTAQLELDHVVPEEKVSHSMKYPSETTNVPDAPAERKCVTYKPGGKSLKSITLKTFFTGVSNPAILRLRAPKGHAFHEMGEQGILEQFVRKLEHDSDRRISSSGERGRSGEW